MKKAHLNKWRQEGPSPWRGAPDDFNCCVGAHSENGSPAGRMGVCKRQVSEISSTTKSSSDVLDLRTNVNMEVKETETEALDLRTSIRKENISDEDCSIDDQVLDLRISNVVSLSGISPIPSCVPESLSDCDTSNPPQPEQSSANMKAEHEQVPNHVPKELRIADSSNPSINITTPNKMLPMEIIESFNLIRNLVIASNGLIPSNTDDPGGTKLEVAQEEVVETSPGEEVPGFNIGQIANGYNYILHPVKIESGTDQTSDMDLSRQSMELSQQQFEILQNVSRNQCSDYLQPAALHVHQNYMQASQVRLEENVPTKEPLFQLPPIKLEPGLGLGSNINTAKDMMDYNHNEHYSNNCVKVENIYPKGVIPSVVTSDDDDIDDVAADSGTESCDSKDSDHNNKKGERKRPGRKKGQVSKVYHLWEFIRDMLADPRYCPAVIKWENEEEGIFRVIQSEAVASLWGAKKNNRTKMTYEKMSRSIRYSRKEGYFADIPKNRGYPKKLCFKFGGKAHGWRQIK